MKKFMRSAMALSLAAAMVLTAAGCSKKEEKPAETPQQTEQTQNEKFDIVVIGGGGAGLTAAIQASQNGAKNVVVLEKMAQTGGNTVRSTGGLNAAGTQQQKDNGIEDSAELMIEDTMKGGKEVNDPELVKAMAENSAAAVDWVNSIGGDLSVVGRLAGASVDRAHKPEGGAAVGPMLMKTLNAAVEEAGIPVMLDTKAEEILLDESGAVKGVKATTKDGEITIDCTAVIIATGGFGANSELVVKYNPALEGFATTNHAGATGDGIVMAEAAGAGLVDIDQIQIHPTVEPTTTTMYTEAVRGNGAILVNKEGKRFINELETRDVVSAAILEQTDKVCYLVFDQKVRDGLSAIESYISKGIITEADSIEELAEKLSIDSAALKETMDAYAGFAQSGTDTEFGREDMKETLQTPKYYAGLCAPAVHHTMGGIKINTASEVLKEDGTVIPGLYAAGEVTGGIHGANRLGGNAVTDIVVFGRIAADSACGYVEEKTGFTELTYKASEAEENVAPEVEGGYKDGVYEGTGKGNGGDIKVEVTVEGGNIVSISLTEHSETEGIYEAAEKGVIEEIIKTQSTEVDAVSGATVTSNGIMEAVADAVKDAK